MKIKDISSLPEPPIGAHLISPRTGFNHHGIYVGRGKIIHYSGMARTLHTRDIIRLPKLIRYGAVIRTSLNKFCDGHGYYILKHPHPEFSGQLAAARAQKRLHERAYYIYSNNCEHFVNWCIDDEFKSPLVTHLLFILAFIGSILNMLIAGRNLNSEKSLRFFWASFFAIAGAFGIGYEVNQALQPDKVLRGRERRNRYLGRIGTRIGVIVAIFLSLLGIKKHKPLIASITPYFIPVLSGIGTYSIFRYYDTRRKELIRENRRNNAPKSTLNATSVNNQASKKI